jgi:uncharacterized protein YoxC
MNDNELYADWYVALIIAGAIIIIAATLLVLVWSSAKRILKTAYEIRSTVVEVKENTRSIWTLQKTNIVAKSINDHSEEIKNNSESLIQIFKSVKKD